MVNIPMEEIRHALKIYGKMPKEVQFVNFEEFELLDLYFLFKEKVEDRLGISEQMMRQ